MKLDRRSALIGAVSSAAVVTLVLSFGPSVQETTAQAVPVDQQVAQLRQENQALMSVAQRAQVMTVIYQLDNAGFHGLDEKVTAGEIPAGALGLVRRARIAAQATMWPESLHGTATQLIEELTHLESAVRDEDVARAKGPAHEVHELGHGISDQAYSWLSGAPSTPSLTHDHDD
jgi:hypothetical protein